jgi:16S rRNA (guanine527-N7)-methyltransferase
VQKKTAFLQQVKAELQLQNIDVVHSRVEDYRAVFDVIVARAFSTLAEFVRATRHLLAASGHWCAMKGIMPNEEIAELEQARLGVRVTRAVKLRVPRLNAERHLLLLEPL